MTNLKHIILLSFFLSSTTLTSAQIIDNNQTELLKPFKAKLAKSKKFESRPHLPELDTNSNKNLNYTVPTHLMGLLYPAPVIRPLAMPKSLEEQMYNFYAKAGFGYPLSPLVEVSYNNIFNMVKFGVNAKHHSILQGYLPNQTFTKTHLDIDATYFSRKNIAIGTDFEFNYNTNRYYGFTDSLETITLGDDSLRQRFIDVKGNVNIFNGKTNKALINYRGDIDFYSYSDRFGTSEFSITPNFTFEKWFGTNNQKHPLRIDVGMNFLGLKALPVTIDSINTNATKSIVLFYFHPTFTVNAGDFKARLGVNLGINETNFFIHPDVELSYTLARGALSIYLGGVGQVRQNSFRSLTYYNPFLVSNPEIHHTNYLELFGGLRGSVKKIAYDVKAGYAFTQNLPYFMNDMDSLRQFSRFKPVYDTTGIIFIRGTLDFRLLKNLVVGGTIGYNIYQPKHFEKAFHLPTFESNFFVTYDIFLTGKKKVSNKKAGRKERNFLSLKAELYINAGVPYLDETQTVKVLQGLYDFSFSIRYQASKNFALFVDLNNIIHNQNQRWYLYRQIGFNGMLGLEVKF
ncbi:MAG: hypothetical protein MK207_09455 [Saprospiraceae bacterium]|nr:hypothetical protein [Saprospiraceae bacterium]